MAKPTFRFKVNLNKSKAPPPQPKEENLVDDARTWEQEVEAKLKKIKPARLRPADWDDELTAKELLAAYNASLLRGQTVELGDRIEATISLSAFVDEWENKHIVTQPLGAKGQRISELVLSADGGVLRLSLERYEGTIISLDHFMGVGITEFTEQELKEVTGYWLQLTRYHRDGDFLISVEQARQRYDRASGKVIVDEEFYFGPCE